MLKIIVKLLRPVFGYHKPKVLVPGGAKKNNKIAVTVKCLFCSDTLKAFAAQTSIPKYRML